MKALRFLWTLFVTTMMDAQTLFSDDQAVTATAYSTNIVDLGTEPQASGSLRTVMAVITETFLTLTSLQLVLTHCATEGGTYTVLVEGPVITLASGGLAAGESYELPIPKDAHQFVKMQYVVGGSSATAGKVKSGIVLAVDSAY